MLLCDSDASVVLAGRGRLTEHLRERKVLVVIDDIDKPDQLEKLLPQCELHLESLVIITSRNLDILHERNFKVSMVQLLPMGRDVQLFEAWAFAWGPRGWDTSELVPKVVARCGRLPLTLKVGAAHALRCAARTRSMKMHRLKASDPLPA